MLKKSLLAVGIIAASANAMATTTVSNASDVDYATEMFGTTDVLNSAQIVLTLGNVVQAGATATFTYTLNDGVFGADPALVYTPTATGSVGIAKASGGVGTDSITFTVAVSADTAASDTFTLTLVSIQDAENLGEVDGVVTVTPVVENTNLVAQGFVETVTGLTTANTTVATGAAGLALTTTGADQTILVADQTSFSGPADGVVIFNNATVDGVANVKQADGSTDFDLVAADSVTITVTGTVAENGKICLAPDGASDCNAEIGTSVTTTSGSTITLTGTQASGLTNEDIVYEVDGDATIPVTTFSIAASVTFDESTYDSPVSYSSTETSALTLAGLAPLDENTRINIITKPGAADETYVRVTNTGTTVSQVYVTLTTQAGQSSFGALGEIQGGETVVYDSQDFADAVGIETWSGRSNALLSATSGTEDALRIVPLVRTNGVLTNQAATLQNQP